MCWEAVWIRNSQRISGLDKMPGRGISLLNSGNWTHLQESGKQSELLTLSTGKEKDPAGESQRSHGPAGAAERAVGSAWTVKAGWVTWEDAALLLGA